MKIYISGQISGLPLLEAYNNFDKVASEIINRGHTAINPTLITTLLPGLDWKAYMTIAYGILMDPSVDAVYMLRNWKESAGAKLEWIWAQAKGKQIIYQDPNDYRRYL